MKAIRWLQVLESEMRALAPLDKDFESCQLSLQHATEELRQIITMASVDLPLSITNAEVVMDEFDLL